jgi:hypothetical protein
LISDPDAPATAEIPDGDQENAMVGVLSGQNIVSEDLINSTLAGFPGGADAFWEGMQGSGIGREELMQMLANEMQPALRNTLLTTRDPLSMSIPQTPSGTQQPPLFPSQSSQSQTVTSTQQTGASQIPRSLQEQVAELTAGLPGASNSGGASGSRREYLSLNDVLSQEVLNRVLEMPGIGERLRPGMPENWDTHSSGVREVIQSPQFQQVALLVSHINYSLSPRSHLQSAQDNSLLFFNNLAWKVILIMLSRFYGQLKNKFDVSSNKEVVQEDRKAMTKTECRKINSS